MMARIKTKLTKWFIRKENGNEKKERSVKGKIKRENEYFKGKELRE
ncbi:MAG: hypothetical protein GY714_25100 [Desulfobacterales bacterium]|nr:hypothetical protein [Desulfobacterales bacterium]